MGLIHSPKIVTDGLVLHLDAANAKSYDKYENLMTNSQLSTTFQNDGGGVSISTDTSTANPFGNYDGVLKCQHVTSTPGYFRRGQVLSLTSGSTYTFSYYFKNDTITDPYNWPNPNYIGTFIQAGIGLGTGATFNGGNQLLNTNYPVGDGWYRQIFTFTPSYTQNYSSFFSMGNNISSLVSSSFYLYGFQLEKGTSATEYYETTSTAKNRSTIWLDMSRNDDNGTLTNAPTFNTGSLGSFQFDGESNYITIPELNLGFSPNNWTFCFWIKPGNQFSRFFTPASNGIDQWIGYDQNNQAINVYIAEVADVNNRTRSGTNNTIPINQWSYSCISISNLNIKIYANSILTNEYNETISIGNWSSVIRLGQRGNNTGWFLGDIAIVKAYNRALTEAEIKQNFNALRGRFGL